MKRQGGEDVVQSGTNQFQGPRRKKENILAISKEKRGTAGGMHRGTRLLSVGNGEKEVSRKKKQSA